MCVCVCVHTCGTYTRAAEPVNTHSKSGTPPIAIDPEVIIVHSL